MTPTPQQPDVRELAAAAVTAAGRCDHPGAESCDPWWIADAVLPRMHEQEEPQVSPVGLRSTGRRGNAMSWLAIIPCLIFGWVGWEIRAAWDEGRALLAEVRRIDGEERTDAR